jgi:hypothetical protein
MRKPIFGTATRRTVEIFAMLYGIFAGNHEVWTRFSKHVIFQICDRLSLQTRDRKCPS